MKNLFLLLILLFSTLSFAQQQCRQMGRLTGLNISPNDIQMLVSLNQPTATSGIIYGYDPNAQLYWAAGQNSGWTGWRNATEADWNALLGGVFVGTNGYTCISNPTWLLDQSFNGVFRNYGAAGGNYIYKVTSTYSYEFQPTILSSESYTLNTLSIYPNPTKDFLHIDLPNELSGKISDLTGKTLMTINSKDIDVSSLSAGIYLLDIVSDDKHYTKKIVKE